MAELVDAPDSKSGSGNRVRVRFSLPAPSTASYWNCDEILLELRRIRRSKNARRRHSRTLGLRSLRDNSLSEPTGRGRLRTCEGRQGAALQTFDRAALRILDCPRRFHGDRRNNRTGRSAGNNGGGLCGSRNRPSVRVSRRRPSWTVASLFHSGTG